MITLPTTSIQPAVTYDGVWIKQLIIQATSPTEPVRASFTVYPFSSTSGSIGQVGKSVNIPDVYALAASNAYIADVMKNLFTYVQNQVTNGSIKF
jgi:hypothetical protein